MQVFLFQEREHVLRLHAENDRLRIQELEDRKKIQHLLTLTQPVNAETTYFIKEPPAKVLVQQHIPRAVAKEREAFALSGRGPGGHKKTQNKMVENQQYDHDDDNVDKETLLLTVEALRAQLEEQTRLCKEQVETLLEDRRVKAEEADVQHQRDSDRVKCLADKLQNTQELLYESTKDYLELKYELRAKERSWMNEKDRLLQQLDNYKQQLDISAGIDPVLGMSFSSSTNGRSSANKGNLAYLKDQLQQTQQLADNYREQCIKLEEEVGRLREESDASKDLFKQRTDKATKRLGLMNTRYQNLEKRRAMEIEGYKNDIKMLRSRLKDVEKQLYKVSKLICLQTTFLLAILMQLTMGLSGDQDEEVLRAVRRTAANSKKLVGDLQTLKARIYSLENDTRHVHDL